MQAWILDESPGNYWFGEFSRPQPNHDDVVIAVVASALNHMDIWVTKGQPRPVLPHIPGCDATGVIVEMGSSVTGFSIGDEVVINPGVSPIEEIIRLGNNSPMGPGFAIWGEHTHGGHAQYAIAPSRNVRLRPKSRTWLECAAFPLAYLTALRMLNRARLSAGETVLIVGIGSGVSTAALSLAKWMGARAIVTSRDPKKRQAALEMGADEAIETQDERWNVQADVVVESVGPATWDKSMRSLAPGGRLVVCGGTSGSQAQINIPRLFFKQYEIIGSSMGSYEEFDQLLTIVDAGLAIEIDSVFALQDYEQGLDKLKNGAHLGKIVLDHRVNQ